MDIIGADLIITIQNANRAFPYYRIDFVYRYKEIVWLLLFSFVSVWAKQTSDIHVRSNSTHSDERLLNSHLGIVLQ